MPDDRFEEIIPAITQYLRPEGGTSGSLLVANPNVMGDGPPLTADDLRAAMEQFRPPKPPPAFFSPAEYFAVIEQMASDPDRPADVSPEAWLQQKHIEAIARSGRVAMSPRTWHAIRVHTQMQRAPDGAMPLLGSVTVTVRPGIPDGMIMSVDHPEYSVPWQALFPCDCPEYGHYGDCPHAPDSGGDSPDSGPFPDLRP